MKVYIKQPVALHEAGKQSINEDFIFPLQSQVNTEERLFIICDGEGGANAGEVASKLVALNVAKYFASHPPKGEVDQDYLDKSIASAEKALSNYKETHPESVQMGTTLALLHFGEKQVTLAWVGNSEVVYFDSVNQKLITTGNPDHKDNQAQALVTGTDSPSKVSMRFLPNEDIAAGDYFFLATDGIQEHVDHATLTALFESGKDPSTNPPILISEIQNLSQKFNEDNYSCYLIQVEKVAAGLATKAAPVLAAGAAATPEPERAGAAPLAGSQNQTARVLTFAALIGIVVCLVALAAYWSRSKSDYARYMADAEIMMDQGNYSTAIIQYDSAYQATEDLEERSAVLTARTKALEALQTANLAKFENSFQNLTGSAEDYLKQAEKDLKEAQFREAALNYERAKRVRDQNQDSTLELPMDRVAYANLKAGVTLFEEQPEDRSMAMMFLERARKMYESPEIEKQDPDAFALGLQYLEQNPMDGIAANLDQQIASAENTEGENTSPTTDTPPASTENTPEPKTSTRGIPSSPEQPASDTKSAGTNSPTARKAPSTQPSKQPLNLTDGSSSSPSPTARLSPSGINTRGSDPAELTALNKFLSEGKRLYVRAKDENSEYLYKISSENLVRAGKALDGPGSYMLSYLYHMGQGIPKDKAKALKFAQMSALKNWPAGHYLYAHLLLERENARDSVTARFSLQRAIDLNYPEAYDRLQGL